MNLLIFESGTGTYTYTDMIAAFRKRGIKYHTISYAFTNGLSDEFFEYRFKKVLSESNYDAVFGIDYYPPVAKCCHENHIKYIAWSYDNPINAVNVEESLEYPEVFLFVFDRIQAEGYNKKGYNNVYYLPLAVDCDRLDRIKLNNKEMDYYSSEISFVGKMYDSMIDTIMAHMDDYCRGYVDAIIKSQSKIYGYYFIDEMITDGLLKRINNYFKVLQPDTDVVLSKEQLSYAMGAQATKIERLLLLKLLSAHHQVKYYSYDKCDLLTSAEYKGTCNYLDQMPRVFKASKINLNITLKILQSGIPLRALDILGSGGFLMSSYQHEIAEYFTNGQEVVMYDSIEDAYDKVNFYLANDDIRNEIAKRGNAKVRELFTYDKQLESLFTTSGLKGL